MVLTSGRPVAARSMGLCGACRRGVRGAACPATDLAHFLRVLRADVDRPQRGGEDGAAGRAGTAQLDPLAAALAPPMLSSGGIAPVAGRAERSVGALGFRVHEAAGAERHILARGRRIDAVDATAMLPQLLVPEAAGRALLPAGRVELCRPRSADDARGSSRRAQVCSRLIRVTPAKVGAPVLDSDLRATHGARCAHRAPALGVRLMLAHASTLIAGMRSRRISRRAS